MRVVVDHVVVNVRFELDEARRRWDALGFRLTPRGHHSLGSSNHLAIFGQDYLELLGIEPGRQATRRELIDAPLGLTGLALKPGNADFVPALQAAGVPMTEPREFSRPVELDDGTAPEARFRTAEASGAVPNGRIFFCHHYTPELVWRDEWRNHPNGALAVAELVFRATDPARLADLFTRMGAGPAAVPGGFTVSANPARLTVLTPDAVAARFGTAVPAEPTDRMVALGIRVRDVAAAARLAGVEAVDGAALVPHEAASGVALVYTA